MTDAATTGQGNLRRIGVAARYSDLVICDGVARFSGYVPETTPSQEIGAQTQDVLDQIAQSLTEIGSDKTKILQATIWLADMRDYEPMNAVWDAWVAPGAAPARACTQARLADPRYRIEIMIVAAA